MTKRTILLTAGWEGEGKFIAPELGERTGLPIRPVHERLYGLLAVPGTVTYLLLVGGHLQSLVGHVAGLADGGDRLQAGGLQEVGAQLLGLSRLQTIVSKSNFVIFFC